MILVDTSVWVDFLRGATRAAALAPLLVDGRVLTHPWIVGELALGHLGPRRKSILADIERLPPIRSATDAEVRHLIEERALAGAGIGWVDAGLLASALLDGARLWTSDRRLEAAAITLDLAPPPSRSRRCNQRRLGAHDGNVAGRTEVLQDVAIERKVEQTSRPGETPRAHGALAQ